MLWGQGFHGGRASWASVIRKDEGGIPAGKGIKEQNAGKGEERGVMVGAKLPYITLHPTVKAIFIILRKLC